MQILFANRCEAILSDQIFPCQVADNTLLVDSLEDRIGEPGLRNAFVFLVTSLVPSWLLRLKIGNTQIYVR